MYPNGVIAPNWCLIIQEILGFLEVIFCSRYSFVNFRMKLCSIYSKARGCKIIKSQSWRLIKNLPIQLALGALLSTQAESAIFSSTFNFDLICFCSLLTYKDAQCFNWKIEIWFISLLSQKSKAVVLLFTYIMLPNFIPYRSKWVYLFYRGCLNLIIETQ